MTTSSELHIANFDGACEPRNPGGFGGWGFVICDGTAKEIATGSGLLPKGPQMTNNVAEYTAALECVRKWITIAITTPLHVRGDSKLVIEQMTGRWRVKQGAYVVVYRELRALVDSAALPITWEWVPRDQNARADELSKIELIRGGVPMTERR